MDYTQLGATGLRVSVMGLGAGGHSRLGMARGATKEQAAALVRRALDLGANLIDTAKAYRTEEAVGIGIAGRDRDALVISTKVAPRQGDRLLTPGELLERAEGCLRRLGIDHVEVLNLHGVSPDDYPYAREALVPALLRLRDQGKIRCLGITEEFIADPGHRMLSLALRDDCWQVMMVGFNLLNPSARERVLPRTLARGIGVLCMFAVRTALSRPEALAPTLEALRQRGQLGESALEAEEPLGFLTDGGAAASLVEAALRFCRHEPGVDAVLSGTGSIEHLERNARAILGPPLPEAALARLARAFGRSDSVSGE